jgi:hypothetical protein
MPELNKFGGERTAHHAGAEDCDFHRVRFAVWKTFGLYAGFSK